MKWLNRIWILCLIVSSAIILVYLVLSLLGWRENMTIFTGTVPLGADRTIVSLKALAYMCSYFASILVVPILLLTALISYLWVRFISRGRDEVHE